MKSQYVDNINKQNEIAQKVSKTQRQFDQLPNIASSTNFSLLEIKNINEKANIDFITNYIRLALGLKPNTTYHNVIGYNTHEFEGDSKDNNDNNNDRGWYLSISGYLKNSDKSDIIENNGKTLNNTSNYYFLARTDQAMGNNSGLFKIRWKIESDTKYHCCVGICTDSYKIEDNKSKGSWHSSDEYVGWNMNYSPSFSTGYTRYNLTRGYTNQGKNIFYKDCKFEGKSLPMIKKNDVIGLIYDSNKSELLFEMNNYLLQSRLTNLPKNMNFYWCIANFGGNAFKASIIDAKQAIEAQKT